MRDQGGEATPIQGEAVARVGELIANSYKDSPPISITKGNEWSGGKRYSSA